MRTGAGFTRRISPVHTVALTALLALALASLLIMTVSPGFAASPAPTCAPLAPPPVPGSPVPPPATPGIVLLNEILTNPGSTWNCAENGTYSIVSDSWVELYNPQSQPFNLYAVHAYLDNGPNTVRFYLPFGSAIAPNGFLVVFPNSSANSTLRASSNLRLVFATTGAAIDQVSFPGLAVNDSYARIPDGSPTWVITTTPTIDASNIETSSTTPMTSTPATSSSPGGSSGSGTGGSTQATTTTTPGLATGTQPAWSKLTLPPSSPVAIAASPTTSVVNTPSASAPSSAHGEADVQRRILLTVLLVLLAGSLFWCWKVFSS